MDGVHSEASDLVAAKEALRHFARSRSLMPRDAAEHDFGELLLYMMKLAGRMDIDVVAVCQQELQKLANAPAPSTRRVQDPDT
jgi:hypothetical protein